MAKLGRQLVALLVLAGIGWVVYATGFWQVAYWKAFPRERVVGSWRSSPEEKARFPRILEQVADELWEWVGDRRLEIARDGTYRLTVKAAGVEVVIEGAWRWAEDGDEVLILERDGDAHRFATSFEGDHRLVLEHRQTALYPPVMVYDRIRDGG